MNKNKWTKNNFPTFNESEIKWVSYKDNELDRFIFYCEPSTDDVKLFKKLLIELLNSNIKPKDYYV